MQKITPFLWFNNHAEEAMNFYVSVFKKFAESKHYLIRGGRAGSERDGHDRTVPDRRPGVCRPEWRPGIHVLTSDLVCRKLRNAGRS